MGLMKKYEKKKKDAMNCAGEAVMREVEGDNGDCMRRRSDDGVQ